MGFASWLCSPEAHRGSMGIANAYLQKGFLTFGALHGQLVRALGLQEKET